MPKLPSMDEIIIEINRIQEKNTEGFTTKNLMDSTGHSRNWCNEKIRALMEVGKIECAGRVRSFTIDGRSCQVPVYMAIK